MSAVVSGVGENIILLSDSSLSELFQALSVILLV